MLESLHLANVGPAPATKLALAHGAIASGYAAFPTDVRRPATIRYRVHTTSRSANYTSTYAPRDQAWIGRVGRPAAACLVVYALADGGFAVWDPYRNFWRRRGTREGGADGVRMAAVLRHLSMTPEQPSGIDVDDRFARLSLHDARDVPMIRTPYGASVSSVHAARGIRRVIAMAYMLSWAWSQHLVAAERLGEAPSRQLVVLVDDVEAHLDERWQRRLLPALRHVALPLTGSREVQVQVLSATSAATVVHASAADATDPQDRLFGVDLVDGRVRLAPRSWADSADVAAGLRGD